MKIIVMGTGYVGLVHAAVCAETGHHVTAFDINQYKIEDFASGEARRIEHHLTEPGLVALINEYLHKTLWFSSDLETACEDADVVFLCLPTPQDVNGSADLMYYDSGVRALAETLARRETAKRVLIVNKSTVPIGTLRHLQHVLDEYNVRNYGLASNPEFLAEGSAVLNARQPDRVVVGCDHHEDFAILRRVYLKFYNHVRIQYLETTPETAEAVKYVANTLLLSYISFWNGVGAKLGEAFPNVNIDDLRKGVTSDSRISIWGSYVSNGAGGSCFGKDIASLIYQMKAKSLKTGMLEAARDINEHQKVYLTERAINEAKFNFNNKTVAVLGLAYKKRTNDMREASSIKVIESLLGKGARSIRAFDPLANESAKAYFTKERNVLFEKIKYCHSMAEALDASDALFISSDCEEFKGLAALIPKKVAPPYLIIDGRRVILDYQGLVEAGYGYLAVGGPLLVRK